MINQRFQLFSSLIDLQIIKKARKILDMMKQTIVNTLQFIRQSLECIDFVIKKVSCFQTVIKRIVPFLAL